MGVSPKSNLVGQKEYPCKTSGRISLSIYEMTFNLLLVVKMAKVPDLYKSTM